MVTASHSAITTDLAPAPCGTWPHGFSPAEPRAEPSAAPRPVINFFALSRRRDAEPTRAMSKFFLPRHLVGPFHHWLGRRAARRAAVHDHIQCRQKIPLTFVRASDTSPARAVICLTVGKTAIEWYDFFLYSTVTGLVCANGSFRIPIPGSRTLEAFATMPSASLARPIVAASFGHYGEPASGRKSH